MRITLIFPVFFSFFLCPAPAQTRYYVNQNASGDATGESWANAFTDLQEALATVTAGDTIWMARGTYLPTATTDRTISFTLKDGVALYGGFAGTEISLAERNIEQHKTILSGDIGAPGMRTDNAYHVVRGKGLGSATLLDGFYIRHGYSYNDFPPTTIHRYGAGMLLEGGPGVADSKPVIQNCFFEDNSAREGGGLCATWTDFSNQPAGYYPVNPVLRHCVFNRNTASHYGGAFYKNGPPAPQDTFILEDCRFSDNKAFTGQGGGVYFHLTANSAVAIRRCLFERDTSWGDSGGAIAYYVDPGDSLTLYSLMLDSCVFRQNLALEGGAFLFDGFRSFISGNLNKIKFDCRMQYCSFDSNAARTANGSAFYMLPGDNSKLNIAIEDCEFASNLASDITAHISFYEYNSSYLRINRCVFKNNLDKAGPNRLCMSVSHGGGAFNTVNTDITNCLFYGNGGGVAATSGARNYNTTRVANCTFFDNNEYIFVKTWDTLFNQPNGYFNDFYIDNCIIWEPGTDLRKMFYNNEPLISNMTGYRVNHSLLSLADSVSVPGAAEAFQQGLIWGQFPYFQDSLAGDFRLKTCSPAVNRGNNNIVGLHGLQTDLDSLPRLRYSIVDLGAYEQQDSCKFVNITAPPEVIPLNIWPNPYSYGSLHFQLPATVHDTGILRIFDTQSQVVFRLEKRLSEVNTLSIDHLAPGFYFVRIDTTKSVFLGKLVRI
ncbi:MAG: T9SS type A sorting domain-containing protein [Thermoanaerobaculia bacterium]|nr:T9SS type A sorting domain-containing protein [Thermoanaerobaculia bacterium]